MKLRAILTPLPWVLLAANGSMLGVSIAFACARGTRVADIVSFAEHGGGLCICIVWIESRTRPTKESVE